MNCPSCQHANPPDAHFCASCGVRVVAHTGDHAEIAGLVNDAPTEPSTPAPPADPTAPFDTMPLDAGSPLTTTAPYGAGPTASGPYDAARAPSIVPGRKSSLLPVVLTVAVVAAIVVIGAVLLLSGGGDDSIASVTSDDAATSTDAAVADPIPGDDSSPTTTAQAVPIPATEVPATAIDPEILPTTVASTNAPPTPATDPAAVPPIPSEPGPINVPGSPQVLANVSPSGLPFAETATAFAVAQEFGDALALQNWDVARSLSPELAGNSDEDFVRGYANTNRVSLILLDARPAGAEIELLVVSVAVEIGGSQTSLYCLHWNVEPNARTVRQEGGSRIAQWQANTQPEAIRNDPDALAIVDQCVWP